MIVALCSAKGSPGVTTLTCALGAVWPTERQVIVAECDPCGGDIAARFGLNSRRGMSSLLLAKRQEQAKDVSLAPHSQRLPGGLEVLVGPVGADSAIALDYELAKISGPVFPPRCDSLVDCGRVVPSAPGQRRILQTSDHLLFVARPDASGLAHTRWALERLGMTDSDGITSLVLVGGGEFSSREASRALGVTVSEVVPNDPEGAGVICGAPGKPRAFARSSLLASARRVAERLIHGACGSSGARASTDADISHVASEEEPQLFNAGIR